MSEPVINLMPDRPKSELPIDPKPYDPHAPARGAPRQSRQLCTGSMVQLIEGDIEPPTGATIPVKCPVCLRWTIPDGHQVGLDKETGARTWFPIVGSHLPDEAGKARAAIVRARSGPSATPRPWGNDGG